MIAAPCHAGPSPHRYDFARVAVLQNDATCRTSDLAAASGSVSVISVAGGRLRGSVDVALADGEKHGYAIMTAISTISGVISMPTPRDGRTAFKR